MIYLLYYLLFVNFVSAILFYSDKRKAVKKRQRIPEKTLHVLEAAGGAFSIITLMYIIRHKNQKLKYFWKTYVFLIVWIAVIVLSVMYIETQ